MDIGANIRKRRMEAEMSQKDLAEKVQVTQSMLCQIERGTKIPTMVLGKEIADALGCRMESLIG